MDAFLNTLKDVLSNVFTDVLQPVLVAYLKVLFLLFEELFSRFLGITLYYIYTTVLKVIDFMQDVFDIFSGTAVVTYENRKMTFLETFFQFDVVKQGFLLITAVAIGFALIFTIYKTAKSISDMALQDKNPISKVMGNALKAAFTFALVPFLCIFMLQLSSVMLRSIDVALSADGGKSNPSMGTVIFLATSMDACNSKYDEYNISNQCQASFTDPIRDLFYSGEKDIYNLQDVSKYFNCIKFDYFIGLILSVFMIVVLIGTIIIFIRRAFEILLLYIVSPLFVSTIPLDDGALFKKWRELFITKFFSAFGSVISMQLLLMIVPQLLCGDIQFQTGNRVTDYFLCLLLIAGGAFAVFKSQHLLTEILNEEEAHRERQNMMFFVNKAKQAGEIGVQAGMAVATGGTSAAGTVAAKTGQMAAKGGQKFQEMARRTAHTMQSSQKKDEKS